VQNPVPQHYDRRRTTLLGLCLGSAPEFRAGECFAELNGPIPYSGRFWVTEGELAAPHLNVVEVKRFAGKVLDWVVDAQMALPSASIRLEM
jgi:hypothetical protein